MVYIKTLNSGRINVSKYEYELLLNEVKILTNETSEVAGETLGSLMKVVNTLVQYNEGNASRTASRNLTSRDWLDGITGTFTGVGKSLYDVGSAVYDLATLKPMDAWNDVTQGVKDISSTTTRLVFAPVALTSEISAYLIQKASSEHQCTPYHCYCDDKIKKFIKVQKSYKENIQEGTTLAFDKTKEYADEWLYNKDPTKIGAVSASLIGSPLLGITEGVVNGLTDIADSACNGWASLENLCEYEEACQKLDGKKLDQMIKDARKAKEGIELIKGVLDIICDIDGVNVSNALENKQVKDKLQKIAQISMRDSSPGTSCNIDWSTLPNNISPNDIMDYSILKTQVVTAMQEYDSMINEAGENAKCQCSTCVETQCSHS